MMQFLTLVFFATAAHGAVLTKQQAGEQVIIPLQEQLIIPLQEEDRVVERDLEFTDTSSIKCQVQVRQTPTTLCGGCLVSPFIVLTAAHCVSNSWGANLQVAMGIGSPDERTVSGRSYPHQKYQDKIDNGFDFAVVVLNQEVLPNQYINTVPVNTQTNEVGTDVLISGYGTSDFTAAGEGILPDRLYAGYLQVKSILSAFGESSYMGLEDVWDGTRPKTASCRGDSGGPAFKLVFNSDGTQDLVLYGVTSFAFAGADGQVQCGGKGPGAPGGDNIQSYYTRTSQVIDFIKGFDSNNQIQFV